MTGTAPHRSLPPRHGSLKGQIRILGLMVVASIALAAVVMVVLFRESSSVQVASASRGLEGELDEIVGAYFALRQATAAQNAAGPIAVGDETALRGLMAEALEDDPGMAGGFFDPKATRLLGYAFPTTAGADKSEPIERAKDAAQRVAKQALLGPGGARRTFEIDGRIYLYRARALRVGRTIEGVVWVSEAVPGIGVMRGRTVRGTLLVLLALTIATTGLAWRITRRLDRAVQTIEGAVAAKESQPEAPVPPTRFEEIDRIGAGVDHLARALESHRREREELEGRLQRADRLATLGKLVAGVAHEVRNPLASIKLKLHLLRQDPGAAKTEAAFSVIQEEIARLDRMVARLLTISKVAADSGNARQDLAALVEMRSDFWHGRAVEDGIRLSVTIDPAARAAVLVDPDAVLPIIDNLLSNAIEALGTSGGTIDVAVERLAPSRVAMAVIDSGPGVEPAAAGRLFEPFFTTREGGTGLGLFLSAEMARRIGGELQYVPKNPRGARFELRVPC